MSPKDPLQFVEHFATNWIIKKPKWTPFYNFRLCEIFLNDYFSSQKCSFFQILKTLRCLSLRYSADFRRSRLGGMTSANLRRCDLISVIQFLCMWESFGCFCWNESRCFDLIQQKHERCQTFNFYIGVKPMRTEINFPGNKWLILGRKI